MDHEDVDIVIPESALKLQGFREWSWSDDFPERGRISFLDGELVVDMSKERLDSHVLVKAEIYRAQARMEGRQRGESRRLSRARGDARLGLGDH
jgi:hypothetical protein